MSIVHEKAMTETPPKPLGLEDPYSEDIGAFLAEMGIAPDAGTDQYVSIPSDQIRQHIKEAEVPQITLLPLPSDLVAQFATPVMKPKGLMDLRHSLVEGLQYQSKMPDGLRLSRTALQDIEQAFGECGQNNLFHGGGIHRVIVGRTPHNNLFVGTENLAIDLVGQDNPSVRSPYLDHNGVMAERRADGDTHNRGLLAIGRLSLNQLRAGYTLSMGLSSMRFSDLDSLAKGQTHYHAAASEKEPLSSANPLRRRLLWGVYAPGIEQ